MERLKELYISVYGTAPSCITPLDGAGSSRKYYRLVGEHTVIGTVGTSISENEAFFYFSSHFRSCGLPVPEVIAISSDRLCYIQTDLGDISLFDVISKEPHDGELVQSLVDKSVRMLADFHYRGDKGIDYAYCYPRRSMDFRSIMWDFNYFKYCFLKAVDIEFDEDRLQTDMEALGRTIEAYPVSTVMLRDYMSRNIMVKDNETYLIDFQGLRCGAPLYDLVSLLWQARAGFTDDFRWRAAGLYYDVAKEKYGVTLTDFKKWVIVFALFRTIQVLGAYGYRGYFQRKAHFLSSIIPAIDNLRSLLADMPEEQSPYLMSVLRRLTELPRFQQQAQADGLTVKVCSFSYKKGIPEDLTGNGGGHVFDCRALHNPGRYDEYKQLTGLDAPVIEFIERNSEMSDFLDACKQIVGQSVSCYVKWGFSNLSVCFGCTGGQHRSVYAAEAMGKYISDKYGVRVQIVHREQGLYTELLPK